MRGAIPRIPRELGDLAHLLFEWPLRRAPRLSLPLCIVLAALVQAGVTLLFSISYRIPQETLPPAPQVWFLPADSSAARQIAPWLDANDPAVFSPQRAVAASLPSLPPLHYRPSYQESPPPLRPLPPETPATLEPAQIPVLGISLGKRANPSANPADESHPPPLPLVGSSVVHWQDGLAALARLAPNGPEAPAQGSAASLQPSHYQVEVGREGLPMHCLLTESSGDAASDEAARVWILAQRFQPSDVVAWGRVQVVWGARTSKP